MMMMGNGDGTGDGSSEGGAIFLSSTVNLCGIASCEYIL